MLSVSIKIFFINFSMIFFNAISFISAYALSHLRWVKMPLKALLQLVAYSSSSFTFVICCASTRDFVDLNEENFIECYSAKAYIGSFGSEMFRLETYFCKIILSWLFFELNYVVFNKSVSDVFSSSLLLLVSSKSILLLSSINFSR